MPVKCVVTDFDGTLLNDEKKIPEKNLTALLQLKNNKILSIIATGRSFDSFFNALDHIRAKQSVNFLPVDYVVFSTGAGVMALPDKRIVYTKSISISGIKKITAYFDRHQIDYMVHKHIPLTGHLLYKSHGQENPDFDHRLSLYNTHAQPLNRFNDQFEKATEVLAVLPEHNGTRTAGSIQKALDDFSVIPATSPLDHQSLWIEVFHKHVSKSASTNWLCRQLGVSEDEVIAIGNDYNDRDLLQWAGRGFVVANAPDDMKAGFTGVRSNNDAGFSQALSLAGLMA